MSLFNELKRRNVFRVGIAYAVTSWLLIQVTDILLESFGAPPWVMQTMFVALLVGFFITLFFAWAFELTPEGVKKEKDVDRSQSIVQHTGQKLNYTIIALLVLALGYFAWDKFIAQPRDVAKTTAAANTVEAEPLNETHSIAVLPFVNMSEDSSNEYFSDGLTEELLNILAKIKEMRVAGRTSSFAFKGKDDDLRTIGAKLNVQSILEGSVRKDDKRNRVRITAQLINVEDGYHLWSETYDRDLDDIFAIQEEIARKVATALKVTLLGEDEERIAAQVVTDVSAYDLYLRGLQQVNIHSYASLNEALITFEQAIEQDPNYLPAKLRLAQAWLDLAFTGAASQAEAVEKSQPTLTSILEKDPANADAHVLMARVMFFTEDDKSREQHLKLALNSEPRNVEALRETGRFIYFSGNNMNKGLEYVEEAERIDPYSVDVLWDLIGFYAFMGTPEATLPYAQRIGEIQPENPNRYWGPGLAYQVDGQLAKSLEFQVKTTQLDPNDYEIPAGIAAVWLAMGDIEQAESWAKLADDLGADQPTPISTRVQIYEYREQYGLAADMAKRALDRKLDNRLGSNNILRRAYISNLVRQGDIQQAIDYYRTELPGAFATPMDVELTTRRNYRQLVDIAVLLKTQDPASERATELITFTEKRMQLLDGAFLPWSQAIDKAALEAARKNKPVAMEQLELAFELGMRFRWRNLLMSNIAFNSLHDEPEFKQLVARFEADMERQRIEAYELLGMNKG